MNETDTDKTLEFGDQSDPLKGLVADDILEMYRASYDVNNSKIDFIELFFCFKAACFRTGVL